MQWYIFIRVLFWYALDRAGAVWDDLRYQWDDSHASWDSTYGPGNWYEDDHRPWYTRN